MVLDAVSLKALDNPTIVDPLVVGEVKEIKTIGGVVGLKLVL